MNKIHKQRLCYLSLFMIGLTLAASFIFYALNQSINVFLTPQQLATFSIAPDYRLRLGGVVKPDSVFREKNGLGVQFTVTDFKHDIPVRYIGILPDLFREGKGVIAEGQLNTRGILIATQVLAKHDENYMPPQVYKTLKENHAKEQNT